MKRGDEDGVVIRLTIKIPPREKPRHILDGPSYSMRKDRWLFRDATRQRDQARKYLREVSHPWSWREEGGVVIWVANAETEALFEKLASCKAKWEHFAGVAIRDYKVVGGIVDQAKEKLGMHFDPKDFPSQDEFEEGWVWTMEVEK